MDRSVTEGRNESIELFVKNGIRFQIMFQMILIFILMKNP